MLFLSWLLGYIICIAVYIIWLKYFCDGDVEAKRNVFENTIVDVLMLSALSWLAIGFIIFLLIFIAAIFIISGLVSLIGTPFKKLINYIIFDKNERN